MYITVREAAAQLGLPKPTVWARIQRNNIPYTTIGNVALVKLEDVTTNKDKRRQSESLPTQSTANTFE